MRFERAAEVTYDVLDGHAVLIDPAAVKMLTLNPVGTLVWRQLEESRTTAELTTILLPMLKGVTAERLQADIESFLDELVAAGLAVTCEEGD